VQIQGSADNDSGTVFNGQYQTQRPGLVLVNGVVYAAFGSQCDYGNWEGWVIGVSEASASITTMWSTEEDVPDTGYQLPGGGIWQSGSAPVVDANGDIFVATGNGDVPSSAEPGTDTSNKTYGEAVVELHTPNGDPTGQLQVVDFFIAADANSLNGQDGDLGSGGPMELPSSMGTTQEPNVIVEDGKQGILYVLNANNLGGYQQGAGGTDDVPAEEGPYGGVWSKPSAWPGNGGYIYVPTAGTAGFETNGGSLNVFQEVVNAGVVSFQLVGQSIHSGDTFGYGSGQPIVTSNGTTSGSAVVWIIHANNSSGADSQLEAFNAVPVNPGSSGSLEEIWQSGTFTSTVFSAPGVDNGKLYVGTKDGTLLGFGALVSSTPALNGTSPSFSSAIVSQPTSGTATFTAAAPTTVTSFAVAGAAFAMGTPSLSLPASLSTGQSITVPVTFTPTALGANAGQLTANYSGATTTVALSGQGVTSSATLTISPTQVNFQLQPIAGSTVNTPVTYTNVSSSAITVTGFTSPVLPFTATNLPTTPLTLEPNGQAGDSVTITITFTPPGSSGDFVHVFNGVFTLDTTAGNFGEAIQGTAAPPAQITTIPNTLNFGDVNVGSSATMNFDLGDQGGFPLTITQSTPPTINGFSALTNPFTQLAGTSDVLAANTSIVETVQFAPTSPGATSATWLLEGNDGNGVQTVTLTGTGVTPSSPPPSSPPPSSPPASPPTTPPPSLTITTVAGQVGTFLTLNTSGDAAGGTLSYSVIDGTATGCAITGDNLSAKSPGTCVVTATKSASGTNPAVSSTATIITFAGKAITRPAPLTIGFAGTSDALTSSDKVALAALARKLETNDSVRFTGYAKGNVALAQRRADVVAAYLEGRVKIHASVTVVTSTAVNKVVATTL
jgi:PQQ-like domain